MFRFEDYYEDVNHDTVDVSEQQIAYVTALGLTQACTQIGK